MGVQERKPRLPAPTEPSSISSLQAESVEGTDLATDVSRRTDRTSYSIPEDGSPITISTGRKREKDPKSTLSRRSQTSLLIEYFEGGKSGSNVQSRPSVRVKVTPSAARKIRDVGDHIQVTEVKEGSRVPSYTKRISLTPNAKGDRGIGESSDDRSLSSYASATEDSNLTTRHPPVEVEVMHKDHGSPLSAGSSPRNRRFIPPNPSEISSMPPDTFAETQEGNSTPRRDRSRSVSKEQVAMDTLKTPSRQRSVSRERLLAQKAMDKLESSRTRDSGGKHKRRSKSRSRSVSKELLDSTKSPRRRSSRSHNEEYARADESSQPTDSQISRRSAGQESFRSGTSGSSINNPKLLQTVEDVIRRLVLPEISEIRQEQKSQRNRDHFESGRRDSSASMESASRESGRRRISKTSSAPDVAGAPKVVLNRSEHEPGEVLSGNSIKGRKSNRDRNFVESPSERGFSEDTATEESVYKKKSRRSGAKEAALAGAGAALTLEALNRHDSRSSLEKEKRRKKRSKSRSRSASLAESHDMTAKDNVPPMPMSSDINSSELTRDSILTERTDRPPSAASQDRQTPTKHVLSTGSRTPTKIPTDLHKGLGTHHTNLSHGDLSLHSAKSDRSIGYSDHPSKAIEAVVAAGAAAGLAAAAIAGKSHSASPEKDEWYPGHGRTLSPIQSVSSFREDHAFGYPAGRDSLYKAHSAESLSNIAETAKEHSRISTGSVPSTPNAKRGSTQQTRTSREIKGGSFGTPPSKEADSQYWYEQHKENDRNRQTFGNQSRDLSVDPKRMTNYTDDSMEGTYHDKVAAGQHVLGLGANPEYRYTPVAARSAVASLHEASNLDSRSLRSDHSKLDRQSYADSLDEDHQGGGFYHGSLGREAGSQGDSPTKRGIHTSQSDGAQSTSQKSFQERMATDAAPQLSSGRHMAYVEDEHIPMTASSIPVADDPLPAIGYGHDDESDIQTNPSIIQGPISGGQYGTRNTMLDSTQKHGDSARGLSTTEAALAGGAAAAGLGALAGGQTRDQGDLDWLGRSKENIERPESMDDYEQGKYIPPTPPNKDEGYISAAPNPRSPGVITPDLRSKAPKLFDEDDPDGVRGLDGMLDDEDPFVGQGHTRHLSGYSHGMPSPLYDSATGKGIDRIQSKDIVALMDHLTVRDAQRNARDTEILVTLVRSAAEMRNSFEDMKKLLNDSERNIISGTDKNTERTIQKHIQGPRPQPLGTPRVPRGSSVDDENFEDLPAKRRNVFRRALKGLSMRSSNDLAKIEEMLVQLLGEVEGLKTAQEYRPSEYRPSGTNGNSLPSDENLRGDQDGYEPEGQAGTSSTTQSGYFSNPPSRQASATRGYDGRRVSEHRISTVPEGDEEQEAYEEHQNAQPSTYSHQPLDQHYNEYEDRLTPSNEVNRGASVPLDTPPKVNAPTAPLSNENTPRTDKSRKHKSNNSSIFPKFSRWSETTASTVARFRGNNRGKNDNQGTLSHSGSEPDFWDHPPPPPPLPQQYGQSEMRSMYPVDTRSAHNEERSPSPLLPHEEVDEPKQQAFRNSMNLQHPQPRQGPTHRYQHHLESQAQNFDSPVSPSSDQWGSNPNLQRFSTGSNNRYSGGAGNLSPISDGGYSYRSASDHQAPPRPAKIPEDPLVPQRPSKIRGTENKPQYSSPLSSEHLPIMNDMDNRYGNASSGYGMNSSPRSASGQIPSRKPVGPRPPSSSTGQESTGTARRNTKRDTFGATSRDDDETF